MKDKKIKTEADIPAKSEAVSNLGYKGTVRIEYRRKGKKVRTIKHNAGSWGLFTGISNYLAGYSAASYIPTKLEAYWKNGGIYESALITPIPYNVTPRLLVQGEIEGESVTDADSDTVEYQFLIQNDSLKVRDKKIERLALYNNLGQLCATLDLTGEDVISTNITSNIVVYWDLNVQNIQPVKNQTTES